jgi:hypothetical protein
MKTGAVLHARIQGYRPPRIWTASTTMPVPMDRRKMSDVTRT